VVTSTETQAGWWTLLSYRVPRTPSAPRIAIWRRLRQLGVAQLGDGLVALPEDARTRELLEWVAEDVRGCGGESLLWRAQPTSLADERSVASTMAAARAEEYRSLLEQISLAEELAPVDRRRTTQKLRRELRRVRRRDYFPPEERELVTAALERLAESVAGDVAPASVSPTTVTAGGEA
jgi:hypothetical protein